ncbi:hypothetical protein H0A64_14925 [Alcaligenaceae bacterium]|nr:hypothetical protein [Alcaligenaceae bacterium]
MFILLVVVSACVLGFCLVTARPAADKTDPVAGISKPALVGLGVVALMWIAYLLYYHSDRQVSDRAKVELAKTAETS